MVRSNALSTIGRMPYAVHMMFYPGAFAFYSFVVSPWMAARDAAAEQEEWDGMTKAKPLDPDHFNPFTPIPFHNNPELVYAYANVNMRNYISKETHTNADSFVWKNYHDSFDHGNKHQHKYNYASV